MITKPYDLVLFGASSFVGQITARYLAQHYGSGSNLTWAIAGRSQQKLAELKSSFGLKGSALPIIVADANSEGELVAMCKQARVVISTVGPYDLYGSKLVDACAKTGTDYVDLTGENLWVKSMIDQHEKAAQKSGARIIHGCGFDSIPSDMGVWFLQQHLKNTFGETANHIQMHVRAMKGGFSGGTVASLSNLFEKASSDKKLLRKLSDPYLLCPPNTPRQAGQKPISSASFDKKTQSWIAPFFMSPTNEGVVLRSNMFNHYADDFVYQEAMSFGNKTKSSPMAYLVSGSLKTFLGAMALKPTRTALKWVLPKPGEGPSKKSQEAGYFDLRFFAETRTGRVLNAQVKGIRDPGYGATARMLAEAAICLTQMPKSDNTGGIWTPASIFDQRLIDRLTQNAGMTFQVL
ncbi:MAG: saccharopine dehydrogenase NADP-binding domain-containing protein [Myxococcota bacterium]